MKTWARASEDAGPNFERERDVLASLDHPHIIKLYEVHTSCSSSRRFGGQASSTTYKEPSSRLPGFSGFSPSIPARHLVLEVCEGGELFRFISDLALLGQQMRERTAKVFLYQMVRAR